MKIFLRCLYLVFLCVSFSLEFSQNQSSDFPQIRCLSDRIVLSVKKSVVDETIISVNTSLVYLGKRGFKEERCLSNNEDAENFNYVLRFPFSDCETNLVLNKENITFSNRFYLKSTGSYSNFKERVIVLLDWSCVYKRKYLVSYDSPAKPLKNKPQQQTSFGQFSLSISAYSSSNYTSTSLLRPPAVIKIGKRVYVELSLTSVKHSELTVALQSCQAQNQQTLFHQKYTLTRELIKNSCPENGNVFLHQTPNANQSRFSFTMFRWNYSLAAVYLQCIVTVCNSTRFTCHQNCSDNATTTGLRYRRYANSEFRTRKAILTLGPFMKRSTTIAMKEKNKSWNRTIDFDVNLGISRNNIKTQTTWYFSMIGSLLVVFMILFVLSLFFQRKLKENFCSKPNHPKNPSLHHGLQTRVPTDEKLENKIVDKKPSDNVPNRNNWLFFAKP